jgi:hypothetical protein
MAWATNSRYNSKDRAILKGGLSVIKSLLETSGYGYISVPESGADRPFRQNRRPKLFIVT